MIALFYFILFTAVDGLFCSVLNDYLKKDKKTLFSLGLFCRQDYHNLCTVNHQRAVSGQFVHSFDFDFRTFD